MQGKMYAFESLESRLLLSRAWYVAMTGSDKAGGTLAQPFQTIQHAAGVAQAGDTVYIRGGTYRETVTQPRSGSVGAPITYKNYNNEVVTIDGADRISAWTNDSKSIYTASMPWDLGTGDNQVFVDGQMVNDAVWPNTSLNPSHPTMAKFTSVTNTGPLTGHLFSEIATVSVSNLPGGAGAWVGATIHFGPGQDWYMQTGTVLQSGPGTLTFAYQHDNAYTTPIAGNPFYLTGKFSALDAAGEWYRDPTSNLLYLWTPASDSPTKHTIEVKRRTWAFELSERSYITVQGIHLFASSIDTDANSNHITLTSLNAKYVSQVMLNPTPWQPHQLNDLTGILLLGSNSILQSSTIAYSSGDGVYLGGSSNTVSGCTIHDTDYNGGHEAGIDFTGPNQTISGNTVYYTGRDGIFDTFSPGSHIVNNTIHDIGFQDTDLGGIYAPGQDSHGTVISGNKIYNIPVKGFGGHCIYLDNGAADYIVTNNAVTSGNPPIFLHAPCYGNQVNNNTVNGKLVANIPNNAGPLPTLPATFTGNLASVTILQTLGGYSGGALAVNNAGQVVGSGFRDSSAPSFLYSNGAVTAINTLGGNYGLANAINASGEIVGGSYLLAGPWHAFSTINGTTLDLGVLPGDAASQANGINASGQIVGNSYGASAISRAFLYSDGKMQAIATLGGAVSEAFAINDSGEIVGASSLPGDQTVHAFADIGGKVTDLGTLGGSISYALAVNNNGSVVGASQIAGNSAFHAFLYANGKMQDLGSLPGETNFIATSINNNGDIVGYAYPTSATGSPQIPFIYRSGVMQNLNALLPTGTGWPLSTASAINDQNQVVGTAASGLWKRAFVLSIG